MDLCGTSRSSEELVYPGRVGLLQVGNTGGYGVCRVFGPTLWQVTEEWLRVPKLNKLIVNASLQRLIPPCLFAANRNRHGSYLKGKSARSDARNFLWPLKVLDLRLPSDGAAHEPGVNLVPDAANFQPSRSCIWLSITKLVRPQSRIAVRRAPELAHARLVGSGKIHPRRMAPVAVNFLVSGRVLLISSY